jgi:hypothetical protein
LQPTSNLKRAATDTLPRRRGRPPAVASAGPGNMKITELFASQAGQQRPAGTGAGGACAAPGGEDIELGDWEQDD